MVGGRSHNINDLRRQLGELLTGSLPADVDWEALLRLANSEHLAPAVYLSVLNNDKVRDLPWDVAEYLSVIHELNRARNNQLREQLFEYINALNQYDIVPILTKGAVSLATGPERHIGLRMMYDLDLTVRKEEVLLAEKVLGTLGYHSLSGYGWGRASACGSIDLHYPPGRYPAYWPDNEDEFRLASISGARLLVPSNMMRAKHSIIHDMVKDGAWWLLRVNMRALFDLYELGRYREGYDWRYLIDTMPDRLTRAAAIAQRRALNLYFGTEGQPIGDRSGLLRHKVRTGQILGVLLWPLRASGRIAWLGHKAGVEWRNRETAVRLAARIVQRARRRSRASP